jgi:hypothetical protein
MCGFVGADAPPFSTLSTIGDDVMCTLLQATDDGRGEQRGQTKRGQLMIDDKQAVWAMIKRNIAVFSGRRRRLDPSAW